MAWSWAWNTPGTHQELIQRASPPQLRHLAHVVTPVRWFPGESLPQFDFPYGKYVRWPAREEHGKKEELFSSTRTRERERERINKAEDWKTRWVYTV